MLKLCYLYDWPELAAYAGIMVAAGIGIPILTALNSGLGTRIGSPAAAGAIGIGVAFAFAATIACFAGLPPQCSVGGGSATILSGRCIHGLLPDVDHVGRTAFRHRQCGILRTAGADDVCSDHRSLRTFRIAAISYRTCPVVRYHLDDYWALFGSKASFRHLKPRGSLVTQS